MDYNEGIDALHTLCAVRVNNIALEDSVLRPKLVTLAHFIDKEIPQVATKQWALGVEYYLCPKCQAYMETTSNYCANCGQRVKERLK